jgi:Amt family ammonium transporter
MATLGGFTTGQSSFINSTVQELTAGPYQDVTAEYVLASAYLVFFMHCGFAMLSVGCVRARFAKHIAILILVDACASAVGFYLFGYAFAWGDHANNADGSTSQNQFIGSQYFALSGLPHTQYYLWVFQWSFAATACTIVSGAIAERTKFEAYVLYSFFMAAWVYPVLTHSVWSTAGWAGMFRSSPPTPGYTLLLGVGAIDFAGSGAVHMVGGFAAAAGCWVVGPRIGRFLPDGTVVEMPGHNTSLFVLGVMILWFGWYGFNPGSQLALTGQGNSDAIANAAITTTLAPAVAGMSSLYAQSIIGRKAAGRMTYDVGVMGNGCLAGLVAITAGCSTVYPWGAVCIGAVAGWLYILGSRVSVALRLDDPLDAIAVHAWNGFWGVIAVGFFAGKGLIMNSYGPNPYSPDPANPEFRQWGVLLGGDGRLLGAQVIYSFWLIGWVLANMIPFWLLLKKVGLFRVPANEETVGLDESYHGGTAYPGHGADDFLDKSVSRHGKGDSEMNGNGLSNTDQTEALQQLRAEVDALKKSMATK